MAIARIRALAGLALALALVTAGLPAPTGAAAHDPPRARVLAPIDDDRRVVLRDGVHPDAGEANDDGPADPQARLERVILALKPDPGRREALERFLTEAPARRAAGSQRWLTPAQFEQAFGAAPEDIAKIKAWLSSHGLTADDSPAGGRAIVFSGTTAQIAVAFRTRMRRYIVDGARHHANADPPQIPAALAPVIEGVVSLNDFRSRALHRRAAGPIADAASAPGTAYTVGGTQYLAAADFHANYNLKPLLAQGINGAGSSVAILGRSNVVLADAVQFRSFMDLSPNPPQVIVNGADPGLVGGDHGESDLDVQWAGAAAPGAAIKLVTSASTAGSDGIALSAQYAVSNDVADVISVSYGACEAAIGAAGLAFFDGLWQQAAAQGITVVVAAGDSGAAGCDSATTTPARQGRAVNGLCSSPYSTCVGGTQFADTASPSTYWSATSNAGDHGSALSYIPENVWNESAANGGTGLWAGGGGSSKFFAKPAWQTGTGVPADGKRAVPDIALSAAVHDGYLVYSSDTAAGTRSLLVFGGTSASAPAFAGLVALINQRTGYRQGNLNPALYELSALQAAGGRTYFHRVTAGNNSVPGATGFSASAATAYSRAAGLGSVDAAVLVQNWADHLPPSAIEVSATPSPALVGQAVQLTAIVTGNSPSGTVQFLDGAVPLSTAIPLASGSATLGTASLSAGAHVISATYSGDAFNRTATSAAIPLTVLVRTAVNLGATPASIAAGMTVTFSAMVSGMAPGGTVQFGVDGAALAGPVTLAGGIATLSVNSLVTAGQHVITAAYSGDASNGASQAPALQLIVTPAPAAINLSASNLSVGVGASVTLTATVSGAAPAGSVQFTHQGSPLGVPVPLQAGVATTTVQFASAGVHAIGATYPGDVNNSAASAATLSVAVAVAITGGQADIPTLPEWAAVILALLLAGRILRHRRRVVR